MTAIFPALVGGASQNIAERLPQSDPADTKAGKSLWTDEIAKRLVALWHTNSGSGVAKILTMEFGVAFTRNAVISKATRLGISGDSKTIQHNMKRKPREKKEHRVTFHVVTANAQGQKRIVRSVSTDLPRLRCIPDEPLNLTLAEMSDGLCRYIAGDPVKDPACYCGRQVREGKSYCGAHFDLCHQPPRSYADYVYRGSTR